MIRIVIAIWLFATLTACGDGQPLFETDDVQDSEVFQELPPGTEDAEVDESIRRYEQRNEIGGGYAESIGYDPSNDTFLVDNLAFDGLNVYRRNDEISVVDGSAIDTLGGYGLYAADEFVQDTLTGGLIRQRIPYYAVLARSPNLVIDATTGDALPRTEVAAIRTGDYFDYGFGGFTYQRRGGTVLPTSGQAGFTGGYAGFRVYNKQLQIDLVEGDIEISLDFDDFNTNVGVAGQITNRVITEPDGTVITDLPYVVLPFITVEGANVLNEDGELAGEVRNALGSRLYEEGFFYAVVAGDLTTLDDNGGEIAGVVVFESDDPRFDDMQVQETGVFVATRN